MEQATGIQMVGLFANDFDVSVRFYREGLGVPLEVDAHGDYHHADMSYHNPYFHFAIFPNEGARDSKPAHVTFVVNDCEAILRQALGFGGEVLKEPRPVPYSGGGVACEVLDPDGNHIELFQPSLKRKL